MKCPNCGSDNPGSYVFCQECFSELPKQGSKQKEQDAAPQNISTIGIKNPEEPYLKDEFNIKRESLRPSTPVFSIKEKDVPPHPSTITKRVIDEEQEEMRQQKAKKEVLEKEIMISKKRAQNEYEQRKIISKTRPLEAQIPNDDENTKIIKTRSTEEIKGDGLMLPTAKGEQKEISNAKKEGKREKKANKDDEFYEYYDDELVSKEKGKGRIITVVFWLVLLLLIGTVCFLGYKFAIDRFGSIEGAVQYFTNGAQAPAVNQQPGVAEVSDAVIVSVNPESDKPAHRFTVEGKDGQSVKFNDINNGIVQQLFDGVRIFNVSDVHWIPLEPDEAKETMEITPKMTRIDASGAETALKVQSFTVNVPQVQFEITEPVQTEDIKTKEGAIVIKGKVGTLGGSLKIGDESITGKIAKDGSFEYEYKIPEFGDFNIVIKASLPQHRTKTITLKGNYEKTAIAIEVDPDVPDRTEDKECPVTGTIEPGSIVKITKDGTDVVTEYDTATGKFSFNSDMNEKWGLYEYKITAEKGDIISEKIVNVIRMPNVNDYTGKAKAMEYSYVFKNPNDNNNGVFKSEGIIADILSSEDAPVTEFIMHVDGKEEQKLKVTYYGKTAVEKGKEYTLYSTAQKNTDDKSAIKMNGYFLYSKEE